MSTGWRESDASDDEGGHNAHSIRKRSSRACDQCRKTKSKCERSQQEDSGNCNSCTLAGTDCTFLGPSFKRGPPKGYIHAIEQRWHQVESLLGAIIACPDYRVQEMMSELRQDDLARQIIGRVDKGPFGPAGRLKQPADATKEDLFASILRSHETAPPRDAARTRRQSRLSREIVSSLQDAAVVPTTEWQENLSNHLASSLGSSTSSSSSSWIASSRKFVKKFTSTSTIEMSGGHLPQRRRLDKSKINLLAQSDLDTLYSMDTVSESDDYDIIADAVEGFGQLSLSENREVRYHGKASGLHLLGQRDHACDRREFEGIQKWSTARLWSPSKLTFQEQDADVTLPPISIQDRLIDLYFIYVHPVFPVVHKARFMAQYNGSYDGSRMQINEQHSHSFPISSPKQESSQVISKLLLLSMFAIAARYSEDTEPPAPGKVWEAGCDYLYDAQDILSKTLHFSRVSTVQALLLLGNREFGMGSMEQAWAYIGMAIRMAIDLGLNRNSDKWKVNGAEMFSPEEKATRRQIWWTCCLVDKHASVCMGRPASIGERDFDTPLPDVNQDILDEPWQILSSPSIDIGCPTVPGRVMSSFSAAGTLSVIVGYILADVYPVRSASRASSRAIFVNLESQLDRWYIDLPESLRFDKTSKHIPPPHILLLHVNYWSAVMLLHRSCLKSRKSEPALRNSLVDLDAASVRAFDLCQSAASHISTIVTTYQEHFGLKRSPPLLQSYVLSAGIMHVMTLTIHPSSVQASLGLRQCITALKEIELVWPSASRALDMLNGVKGGIDTAVTPYVIQGPGRHKRHADDAFGTDKNMDYFQAATAAPEETAYADYERNEIVQINTDGNMSTRMMAHMLGLEIPVASVPPATTPYSPTEYEWWSRMKQEPSSSSSSSSMNTFSTSPTGSTFSTKDTWLQGSSGPLPSYAFDLPPNDYCI